MKQIDDRIFLVEWIGPMEAYRTVRYSDESQTLGYDDNYSEAIKAIEKGCPKWELIVLKYKNGAVGYKLNANNVLKSGVVYDNQMDKQI